VKNTVADATDRPNQAGGNQSTTTKSAEGNSQGQKPRKQQDGDEDSHSESDDNKEEPPPPPPSPSPPPSPPLSLLPPQDSEKVVHLTDIHLTLLSDICGEQFIRPITKVKVCEYDELLEHALK